jgi:hypothetical protein
MKRICILTGQNPTKEMIGQFYEELKSYELSDFLNACKDREMLKETLRLRLNLITLEDYILKYRAVRIETESKDRSRKMDEEAKAFFKKQDIPKEVKEFIRKLRG